MKPVVKVTLVFVMLAALGMCCVAASLPRLMFNSAEPVVVRPRVVAAVPRVTMRNLPDQVRIEQLREYGFDVDNVEIEDVDVDDIVNMGVRSWGGPSFQGPDGDRLVLGGTFTLEEGETLDGNLVVMGGIATLEEDSTVEGDVVVFGGTVRADGTIEGEVVTIGGLIELGDSAVVEGDVSTIGGHVERADGAVIEGRFNNGMVAPISPVSPDMPIFVPEKADFQPMRVNFNPFWETVWNGIWVLLRSFIWAVVAVLVVLFLPDHTERAAETAVSQTIISGALGLLTAVVAPLLMVVIAITIIGIPVSLMAALLLTVAWAFGVVVVGMEVGKRLAQALKQEWALAVSAGVGTFALTLVANGLSAVVPCFGWLVPALVGMVGLGAVMLTRFGTQYYPPDEPAVPMAPPPALDAEASSPPAAEAAEDE